MKKLLFLVPVRDNDGRSFHAEDWEWVELRLLELAGGFTMEGEVLGQWRGDDGTVYQDTSRRYAIAMAELEQAWGLLGEVKKRFRQEALYTEQPEVRVEIL